LRINCDSIISAPIDLSQDWASEPIWLGHVYMYSVQLEFDGDPTGTFSLQCSNDLGRNTDTRAIMGTGVVNWTDISGSDQSITESGDHTWECSEVGYRWARIVWTNTGASGSLNSVRINTKGT